MLVTRSLATESLETGWCCKVSMNSSRNLVDKNSAEALLSVYPRQCYDHS